ncbi:MAG: DUF4465 domain-containing protein, partial [Planctomycetales bacterium]|nr:DUF4465 domain-containing protein [Planctomycetales bacterium]
MNILGSILMRLPQVVSGVAVLVCVHFYTATTTAQTIIGWDDIDLSPASVWQATATDQSPIQSNGASLNRTWMFDCCPGGWTVSNRRDQLTPGYTNSYSAFAAQTAGGGYQSDNFAVADNFSRGDATITFDAPTPVLGMYVTNTTYAYLAIVNGDDGGGFVKGPFTTG